jgi:hypothetical protein
MLLILKGHLVPARSVSNRLIALFGNMYFIRVDSYTLLVQMLSGRHSAKSVMGEIVV